MPAPASRAASSSTSGAGGDSASRAAAAGAVAIGRSIGSTAVIISNIGISAADAPASAPARIPTGTGRSGAVVGINRNTSISLAIESSGLAANNGNVSVNIGLRNRSRGGRAGISLALSGARVGLARGSGATNVIMQSRSAISIALGNRGAVSNGGTLRGTTRRTKSTGGRDADDPGHGIRNVHINNRGTNSSDDNRNTSLAVGNSSADSRNSLGVSRASAKVIVSGSSSIALASGTSISVGRARTNSDARNKHNVMRQNSLAMRSGSDLAVSAINDNTCGVSGSRRNLICNGGNCNVSDASSVAMANSDALRVGKARDSTVCNKANSDLAMRSDALGVSDGNHNVSCRNDTKSVAFSGSGIGVDNGNVNVSITPRNNAGVAFSGSAKDIDTRGNATVCNPRDGKGKGLAIAGGDRIGLRTPANVCTNFSRMRVDSGDGMASVNDINVVFINNRDNTAGLRIAKRDRCGLRVGNCTRTLHIGLDGGPDDVLISRGDGLRLSRTAGNTDTVILNGNTALAVSGNALVARNGFLGNVCSLNAGSAAAVGGNSRISMGSVMNAGDSGNRGLVIANNALACSCDTSGAL